MGERTEYSHGAFSWTDLTTKDQEAAKKFYSELFGWETTDNEVGEDAYYTMAQLDGKDVAAISAQPEGQQEAGVPPTWNSYITVDSADEALKRAKELGAEIHSDAFDVMDVGRMGVVQDPQGAFFLVWEPKSHIGASLVNAPGALAWNELATPDLDASAEFYSELFGWETEEIEAMEMPYRVIKRKDGGSNGGMRPTQENEPPYWLVYFGVDDIESKVKQASENGAQAIVEPTDIGMGQIAVMHDPQGAVFALFAGRFDD
jgi:predicted enzyme related to lactoylglutathione lyase